MIRIKDNIFKFGISDQINIRLANHRRRFMFESIITVIDCGNKTISEAAENLFRDICRCDNLFFDMEVEPGERVPKEVIRTDNIVILVDKVTKFIDEKRPVEITESQLIDKCDNMEQYERILAMRLELAKCNIDTENIVNKKELGIGTEIRLTQN